MKIITTTTSLALSPPSRREIAVRHIKSLSEVRGIDKWYLYVGVERGCEADRELYEAIDFMPVVFHDNEAQAQCTLNTLSIFSKAFMSGVDFLCHIENDILVSPDYVEYFDRLIPKYAFDPSIFSINAYTDNEDMGNRYKVYRRPWMTCWGVGFGRMSLAQLLYDTTRFPLQKVVDNGWDCHAQMYTRQKRMCIHPYFSRCLHIGIEGLHDDSKLRDVPAMTEENRTWGGNDPVITTTPTKIITEGTPVFERDYIRVKIWSPE